MEIVVYSKPSCLWCDKAKNFLEHLELPYREIVIGINITGDEVKAMFPGVQTAPVVVINGEWIGGCTELMELLK